MARKNKSRKEELSERLLYVEAFSDGKKVSEGTYEKHKIVGVERSGDAVNLIIAHREKPLFFGFQTKAETDKFHNKVHKDLYGFEPHEDEEAAAAEATAAAEKAAEKAAKSAKPADDEAETEKTSEAKPKDADKKDEESKK